MPLSTETIKNTALNGEELKELVMFRVKEALDQDWLFKKGPIYPEVAFEVQVTVHMRNPILPKRVIVSKENGGRLGEIKDTTVRGLKITQPKISPNIARVGVGMPITVTRKVESDGQRRIVEEPVKYSREDCPEMPKVEVLDNSAEESARLGVENV